MRPMKILPYALCTVMLVPSLSLAQAWVPAPGQGSLSLSYQYTRINDHLFSQVVDEDKRLDLGKISGQSVELSAGYGLLPGLAINVGIAYVSGKYVGVAPEGPLDDGRYHGDLQDVSLGARYMAQWQGFAITPQLGGRLPAKNYDDFGHVAVGRGLHEISVGIAVGRSLSPLLPAAYATAQYERAFVEDHHQHDLDRNRLGLNAGYIVSSSISLGGSLSYLDTVDGIDWLTMATEQEFHIHDVAAKEKALRAGGFASVNLWRGLGLTVSYGHTLSGENSHASRSFTVSPIWSFSAPYHW